MSDRPAARAAEREPLPFSPSAPGCAFSVHVRAGQWGGCEGQPSITGVWASPQGERWRVFACTAHAYRFDGAQWRDVGPLDDATRSELTDRRARWAAALAGKEWRPPRPMEPERPTRQP